jgi:sugar lactone lactonase YvrE
VSIIVYHALMPPRLFLLMTLLFAGCGDTPDEAELVWGKRGIQPGDFIRPRAITIGVDAAGNEEIYVVDYAGRVQVFTPDGKPLRLWSTPTIANGRPAGLCWSNAKKQLIVADSHYQQILLYEPDGTLIKTIPGTLGAGNLGPYQYVADVAEDEAGNLYVSEFGNENEDRIRVLNPAGEHLRWFGAHGTGEGEFSRPRGLALHNGELFVTDSCNHRIQVFSLEGKYLRSIGSSGAEPGQLQYPYDVAVRSDGTVFIAEWGQHRIQKFDIAGKSLRMWGKPGRAPGCLSQPWGLAVSAKKVFILDSENHRVQRVGW